MAELWLVGRQLARAGTFERDVVRSELVVDEVFESVAASLVWRSTRAGSGPGCG